LSALFVALVWLSRSPSWRAAGAPIPEAVVESTPVSVEVGEEAAAEAAEAHPDRL
jgi:hypothetical protein